MNDKITTQSWIHVEKFSETHSWKQTWMFLGGAVVVFAFALLYEIDKDLSCKNEQALINSFTQARPNHSEFTHKRINLAILLG